MKLSKIYCGSKHQQICITPRWLYKLLDERFHFDFDPAPLNPTFDGLTIEWGRSNYINPPYSNVRKWLEKGIKEFKKGKLCVFLLPAYTHRKWFHDLILKYASEIIFIQGNLRFENHKNTAPFPSMIVVFDPNSKHDLKVSSISKPANQINTS